MSTVDPEDEKKPEKSAGDFRIPELGPHQKARFEGLKKSLGLDKSEITLRVCGESVYRVPRGTVYVPSSQETPPNPQPKTGYIVGVDLAVGSDLIAKMRFSFEEGRYVIIDHTAEDITMRGVRRDYADDAVPQAGEYGRLANGQWYCVPPGHPDMLGNLSGHEVVEHEDKTITVSPSILISQPNTSNQWHGYLERGVWRKA